MADDLELGISGKNEFLEELKKTIPALKELQSVTDEFLNVQKQAGIQASETMRNVEKQVVKDIAAKEKQIAIAKKLADAIQKINSLEGAQGKSGAGKAFDDMAKGAANASKEIQTLESRAKKLQQTMVQQEGNIEAQAAAINEFVNALNPEQVESFFAGAQEGLQQFEQELEKPSLRLRELKRQLATMDEGDVGFQGLAIEAARLEDKIGDVRQRVRNLASDTAGIDALISAAEGATGAFAIAEGAAGLFGEQSEDLQKTLLKVQSAMAILNGLQAVQKTLLEESAARTIFLANSQKILALATGQATGAAKAFRLALLATGIGALVIALGALVANFDEVQSALGLGVNPETEDYIEKTNRALEATKGLRDEIELEVRALKAKGASQEEIATKQIEGLSEVQKATIAAAAAEGFRLTELKKKYDELDIRSKSLGVGVTKEDIAESQKRFDELLFQAKTLGVESTEILTDLQKEQAEKEKTAQEKRKAAQEKANEKLLQLQKKHADDIERFNEEALQLLERQDEAYINSLTGEEKILAQIAFQDQLISVQKESLEREIEQSELTAIEKAQALARIDEAFTELRKNVISDGEDELRRFRIDEAEKNIDAAERIAIAEATATINAQRDTFATQEDFERAKNEQIMQLRIRLLQDRLASLKDEVGQESEVLRAELLAQISDLQLELSAASKPADVGSRSDNFLKKLFGVDDDGLADVKDLLGQAFSELEGFIQGVLAAQLQASESRIRQLEDEIDAQQQAVDRQLELQEEGKANSVATEQARLAELKKQREQALKEQVKLRRQQAALETAQQIGALSVTAAQMFASQAPKGLIGVALAVAAIGTIFAAFQRFKSAASQGATQLRKGGKGDAKGLIEGKSHEQGGEKLLDHIEVEGGERWSVFNRSASRTYGKEIEAFTDAVNAGQLGRSYRMPMMMSMTSDPEFQSLRNGGEATEMRRQLQEANKRIEKLTNIVAGRPDSWQEGEVTVIRKGAHIKRFRKNS